MVKGLSHELKTYISLENLDDKRRMLFNWKNSTLIKHAVGEDVTKQLLTINQQESSLKKADELLNKVVDRTAKKLYPELDFEQTTAAERRELIKETNSEQTIFKGSELNERLMNIRDDLLTRQLLTFTKRPYVGWKLLMQQEKEVKIELKYTLMIHDDSLESLEHVDQGLLEKYSPTEQQARLKQKIEREDFKLRQSKYYENRQARKARSRRLIQKGALLEKYFQANNLSVEQTEELLKTFADYVNAHKPDKLKNDQPNN